ncbi:hypothetical protein GCK72_022068 [Caenorhabditis remanei]|uniref:DDE-1 domain-containing protein n=1 Tax=Caenorhabditis remanei TaxID=31234 RepID=A0A6A5FTA5_CAERE|nr:hypothetical protein GCK72_022068 [Caenorhabditis remanei]KAF1745621.1 hypothetical protein GCK72_022068 [Caenorhabditis remanei]
MSASAEKKTQKEWPFEILAVLIKSIYFETEIARSSITLNDACERFFYEIGDLSEMFPFSQCVLRSYKLLTSKEVLDKRIALDTSQKAMMLFKLNLQPDPSVLDLLLDHPDVTDQKCIEWLLEIKEVQMKKKSQAGPSSSNNVGLSAKRKRQGSAEERQAKERRQSSSKTDSRQASEEAGPGPSMDSSYAEEGASSYDANPELEKHDYRNTTRKLGKRDEDFDKVVQDVSSRKRHSGHVSVERCIDFFLHLEQCHKRKAYNFVHVCDEVELKLRFFKKSSSELNTFQSKRSVLKHKEVRLTIMLTAKSTGAKHLPYILIREGEGQKRAMRVEVPRCKKLFSGKLNLASTSLPHFTPKDMISFLKSGSGPDESYINQNLLIWDSNIAHNHNEVIDFLNRRKTDVVCFPEEENNTLQIADLFWKPKLLVGIRNNYKQWWIETGHLQTEPPSMEDYLPWIVDAWNSITRKEIVDSFASCGLDIGSGGIDPSKIRCFNKGGALENHVGLLDSRRQLRAQNKEDFEDYVTISNVDISFEEEAGADPHLLQAVKDVSREKKCFLKIGVIECIDFLVTLEHMMLRRRYQQILAINEVDLCFSFQKKAPLWQKQATYHKVRITVLLAAKLDGSKCRPFVVLPSKRKLTGKEWKQFATIKNQFKSRIELNAKPESSIDSSDLKRLLPTFLGRSQTTRKLVVWDSRSSHEEMTRFLKSRAVDSILVPENAVEVLQAANIYWKPEFIANLRENFQNWRETSADPTPDVPANDVFASWIADSWERIPKNRIQESFVGTGLSGWRGQLDANRLHCFGVNGKLDGHRNLMEKRRSILATHMDLVQVEDEESEGEEDVDEEVELEGVEGNADEDLQGERPDEEELEEEDVDLEFDVFDANMIAAAFNIEGNARPAIQDAERIESGEEEEKGEDEEEAEDNHEVHNGRLDRMEDEVEDKELDEDGAEETDDEQEPAEEDEEKEENDAEESGPANPKAMSLREPSPEMMRNSQSTSSSSSNATSQQPSSPAQIETQRNPELQKPIKAHLILLALRECASTMSRRLFDEFLKTLERQRYLTDVNKTVPLEILVDSVESIESRLVGNKTPRGDETNSVSLSVALAGFESFLATLNEEEFQQHLVRIRELKAKFENQEFNVLFEKIVFFFDHIFVSACQ